MYVRHFYTSYYKWHSWVRFNPIVTLNLHRSHFYYYKAPVVGVTFSYALKCVQEIWGALRNGHEIFELVHNPVLTNRKSKVWRES